MLMEPVSGQGFFVSSLVKQEKVEGYGSFQAGPFQKISQNLFWRKTHRQMSRTWEEGVSYRYLHRYVFFGVTSSGLNSPGLQEKFQRA